MKYCSHSHNVTPWLGIVKWAPILTPILFVYILWSNLEPGPQISVPDLKVDLCYTKDHVTSRLTSYDRNGNTNKSCYHEFLSIKRKNQKLALFSASNYRLNGWKQNYYSLSSRPCKTYSSLTFDLGPVLLIFLIPRLGGSLLLPHSGPSPPISCHQPSHWADQ